jgi:3-isopropylmalate dehydrogenase
MHARVALLPGDGIGPEVIDSAVTILTRLATLARHTFEFIRLPIGGVAIRAGGRPLAADTLDACLTADAVLLGAVGDPQYDHLPPDSRPESALLRLRRELGAFANLRPARVYPGLEETSPLKPERLAGTDLLIVRELTGGLYFGEPRGLDLGANRAVNTLPYSASEIERVAVIAFEAARRRRQHVTLVDKANVLETSQLWRHVVGRVAARYTDVRYDMTYVDSAALRLVLEPSAFDVMLTENLFGDILSDEAGGLVGSLGLLGSASIGGRIGIFEPVHGSAPTLVGTDSANPIGAISSAAMMLQYGLGCEREARAIDNAVGHALAAGCVTKDLARPGQAALTCSAMTAAIADRLDLN